MKEISEADLERLRQIARDSVFEPFEGRKSLERLQKTRDKMEKGVSGMIKAGRKAGKWVSETKLARLSKSKLKDIIKDAKAPSSSRRAGLIKKFERGVEKMQKTAKSKYRDIEEKILKNVVAYMEQGIESLILEDTEEWILKRAAETLNRPDLNDLEDIRRLEPIDRDILTAELYHYDNPSLKKLSKSFDTGVNTLLGAVVATNLPGTGLAVSLINMGKTIVKMSSRLNTMSAIYGRPIRNRKALFKVVTMIAQSLEDWENNYDHVPLNPRVLDILYREDEGDSQAAFQELLNAIAKKEAYIAVPGVGMISLGKINLDDLKTDLTIKHMVRNYFAEKESLEKLDERRVKIILSDFRRIYSAFVKSDYFKASREKGEKERLDDSANKLKTRIQLLAGIDLALEKASGDLDDFAGKIFHKIHNLPEKEKEAVINGEINEIL